MCLDSCAIFDSSNSFFVFLSSRFDFFFFYIRVRDLSYVQRLRFFLLFYSSMNKHFLEMRSWFMITIVWITHWKTYSLHIIDNFLVINYLYYIIYKILITFVGDFYSR